MVQSDKGSKPEDKKIKKEQDPVPTLDLDESLDRIDNGKVTELIKISKAAKDGKLDKKTNKGFGKDDRSNKGKGKARKMSIDKVWDSKMSKSPDLQKQTSDSPIKYRYPDLVDIDTGVITPSLILNFINIFPSGVKYSLYNDYWFNNEYLGKLENMAMCYNGSDSLVDSEYIGNYFRGTLDTVGIYVQLSAISLLCERRTKGEFDSDDKFKASIGVLADYFQPNSAKFRNEMALLKQAIESFYLPPELLLLVEETYSPKFSKYAGIRTVELMSLVYPVHPSLLCYTEGQTQFDVDQYKDKEKELVSLFIDSFFWSDLKTGLDGLSIPRRSSDRVWNFIRNTRTCLEVSTKNARGEYFGLHEIMKTVVPEYSLVGKLKDNYNVVNISDGGRFARINNSQNEIAKSYSTQQKIDTVYSSFRNRRSMTELFGSIDFGGDQVPALESSGTYVDNGSGGRSGQGAIYNFIFDQIGAYHQTRGESADLSGEEILKLQFGYEYRDSKLNLDGEEVYFKEDTIQPGLMVKVTDRNGGSFMYTVEDDYTNVLKNVVNFKPEAYRWFLAVEQPKYSKLTIKKGTIITDSRLVGADGLKLDGVDVEPCTINDSELVACYFDLNCVKRKIGEIVKQVWRSSTLVDRVLKYPNGPTERYSEDIN